MIILNCDVDNSVCKLMQAVTHVQDNMQLTGQNPDKIKTL